MTVTAPVDTMVPISAVSYTHLTLLENVVNELVNAEARREALEGEYVFSSSNVDELMEFLNSDD